MQRQKYHLLLFFLSIPFPLMLFKGWWSGLFVGWGPQAFVYLGLFALLAEVYFAPRKLVVAGMIGIGVFILGLLLKVLHWPGAQLSILLSTVLLIIIPLWSALLNSRERKLNIIIALWIMIFGTGVLFQMFNWPSRGFVTLLSWAGLPIVTLSIGISLWKNKPSKA